MYGLSCNFKLLTRSTFELYKHKHQSGRFHHNVSIFCTNLTSLIRLPIGVVLLSLSIVTATSAQSQLQDSQSLQNLLQQAEAFEAAADYQNAVVSYREYLLQPAPKSAARRHAKLKLPVLQEAVKYGAGPELTLYLDAMNLRAAGDIPLADATLEELINTYPRSLLADDAWYLRAYIALMDQYDYQRASDMLQSLRYTYPESRYTDTALFAEAIVQEQLGNSDAAIAKMTELRDRHTGLSLAGFNLARDEYLSKLWFKRSSDRIEYLQQRAETATRLLSITPYGIDGYQWQAELVIAQQTMTVLLNESDTISDVKVKGAQVSANTKVDAFSGIVMGQPDSWVRITIKNKSVRGMISVYGERIKLVPVTSGGSLSDFNTLLLGDADGNISDGPDHVLVPPKSEDPLNNYLRGIRQVNSSQLQPGEVSQVAQIGVVIDSKYNDYFGGLALDEALSILNTTDGIFREQIGIALKVDSVIIINDRENDPFNLGSVTMETMMRNFRDYRLGDNDLGSDIGLATLFSANKNNDAALGLAWIGSACRTDGFDVSVVTPYRDPALLSTHEIGHTMGAPHDTDTSCDAQKNHIMWPFLSSALGNTFSSCSKESIATTMAANNCHVDAIDLSVALDNVNTNNLNFSVNNQDQQRATPDAIVQVSGPGIGNSNLPKNCKRTGSDAAECSVGTLSPLQSKDYRIEFSNPAAENAEFLVSVQGIGFLDVVTNNNSIQTDISGAVNNVVAPINNDVVSLNAGSGSSGGNNFASAEGGGLFQPVAVALLALLVFIRRRIPVASPVQ